MERQQISATRVAEFLDVNSKVARVAYPGLDSFPQKALAHSQMRDIDGDFAPGAMIYFEIAGTPQESYERAKKLIDHIAQNSLSITLAVSLGQIRSLVEHPASMTHAVVPPEDQLKAGISPGGVRLSLGLEDVRDILRDLEEALETAFKK
jgi:methionine-gamma-lyase